MRLLPSTLGLVMAAGGALVAATPAAAGTPATLPHAVGGFQVSATRVAATRRSVSGAGHLFLVGRASFGRWDHCQLRHIDSGWYFTITRKKGTHVARRTDTLWRTSIGPRTWGLHRCEDSCLP
jgi:hypothetical protein